MAKYSVVLIVLDVLVVKTARHVGCSCAKKTHNNGSCSPGLLLGYTRIPFDVHTAVSSGLRVYLVAWYAVLSRFGCEPRAILGVGGLVLLASVSRLLILRVSDTLYD